MNRPCAHPRPLDMGSAEAVLVARSGPALLTDLIGPAEAGLCRGLAAGASVAVMSAFARGIAPDFDPAPALARLIRAGLITGIIEEGKAHV
jgi:hypothetical protein